jgi:hypothetical protein
MFIWKIVYNLEMKREVKFIELKGINTQTVIMVTTNSHVYTIHEMASLQS